MISIYGGTGFIGSAFYSKYKNECCLIDKFKKTPTSEELLYFISTVDNYNVYTDPYLDINTNLIKLVEVLEELRYNDKKYTFNFISSWFVYGKTTDLPANENSPCNPTGFYSITKHAAEKLLISYCNTFKINYRIFRLTNIIGIGDKKISKKKNAIQFMINCLAKNETVELYDGGTHIRDYMDVDDACRAIYHCIKNAPVNEIINISNSQPKTIGEIIEYSKNKLNSKSDIVNIIPTNFHEIVQIKNMWLDNSKLTSYGYVPKISVIQSIDKILETM